MSKDQVQDYENTISIMNNLLEKLPDSEKKKHLEIILMNLKNNLKEAREEVVKNANN